MGGCKKLRHIDLCGKGAMSLTRLPKALRCLRGDGDVTITNLNKAALKRRHPKLQCIKIKRCTWP